MSAGPERRLVRKVVGYVVRDRRLLVFTHDDVPLEIAGVQVPAGTIEPSELPEAAVVREVLEETGVIACETHSIMFVDVCSQDVEQFVTPIRA